MARTVTAGFRNAAEAPTSDDDVHAFLTITHPDIVTPLRYVDDLVDYIYGGNRYTRAPFVLSLLTDSEQPPRGALIFPNVDREVGEAIAPLTDPLRLKIVLLAGSDFGAYDLTQTARLPLGTPDVEWVADHLFLRNIKVDVVTIEAEVSSWDMSTEPWPAIRSTKSRLPGLYR